MVKSFKCGNSSASCSEKETLENIENLLQLHGYETNDLIHQYYIERYQYQTKMNATPFGQLTIRSSLKDDKLEVSRNHFLDYIHTISRYLMN